MSATPGRSNASRTSRLQGLRHASQALLAGALLLLAAGAMVALLSPTTGPTTAASSGQVGAYAALLIFVAGAALVAAGLAAWDGRRGSGLAIIAFAAAAAWLAPELAGSATAAREARSLGLLVAPFFVPLVVHLPLRALRSDEHGRWRRGLLLSLYLIVGAAALGHALTYDPFFDVHCSPVCGRGDNVLAIAPDTRLASFLTLLWLGASVVAGLALATWSARQLVRDRRDRRHRATWPVLIPALALGAALAAWAGVRIWMSPDVPSDPLLLLPTAAVAVAVTALGSGVAALTIDRMQRAEALRRFVQAMPSSGSPSLRATLSRTLADDDLRVAYPTDGGGFVDEMGIPVDEPRSSRGRSVAAIRRGDALVALVEHDATLDPDQLDREIGAAARLAVDNDRLEATIRARLRELQASRSRIVEAGDAARGGLERDLHDGAQQRLLALSFELRLIAAGLADGRVSAEATLRAALRAAIDGAVRETDAALGELRELAHGIHPVVLSEDGLAGALPSLADEAAIPVVVSGADVGRCSAQTELAAYLAVEEAIDRAEVAMAPRVDVQVAAADGRIRLTVMGHGLEDGGRWTRIEDRVGAAGGHVAISTDATGMASMRLDLPCA